MKRVDIFAFSLSLLINILLLLIISNFSNQEVVGKIKVGLVTMENKKNNSKSIESKQTEPLVEKKEEKKEKKEESVKEVSKKKILNLDAIEITAPKLDVLNKKKIKAPKKTEQVFNETFKSNEVNLKRAEGASQGYKLGAMDGDIVATWDPKNKEPKYPESAQLRGLNGTVTLRLNIDEYGNIKKIDFQKGSGVPEINLSIEKVARTWKIYLKKNSKVVRGEVILEYNFKLTASN